MKTYKYFILILCCCMSTACEKFLDIKPDKKLALPSDKLENLKLLLDDTNTMNQQYPAMGEAASDNVYIPDSRWDAVVQVSATSGNAYLWQRDVFNDNDRNDWSLPYAVVFNANLVLEGTREISPGVSDQAEWNMIRGSALFFRAYAFYALLQEFAKPYIGASASQDPGIVLKLNTDINERSRRASVKQCYEQVLRDLSEAASLLPLTVKYKTEPSRAAATAMLARTFLSMSNYKSALENAEKSMQLYPGLIDYSTLNPALSYPFKRFNEEVIFHASLFIDRAVAYPYARADEKLYNEYGPEDLRRDLFFRKNGPDDIQHRGSYDGSFRPFGGIANDEVYLIAAECLARGGQTEKAMNILNLLLSKRFRKPGFVPLTASDEQEALDIVLKERRKELLFRNLRWGDLKRLNAEPRYRKTIEKVSKGITYSLSPDKGYIFPIPKRVIEASGMSQN